MLRYFLGFSVGCALTVAPTLAFAATTAMYPYREHNVRKLQLWNYPHPVSVPARKPTQELLDWLIQDLIRVLQKPVPPKNIGQRPGGRIKLPCFDPLGHINKGPCR